ncbi:MAG TPA: transporter substrate-binding domain-containing protein [Spirochaetia bacterium]|nr:transporter substrate-binding domain-containing protein [Spirochaetaceae bacterium]HPE89060.1 transporter substrate-binding domain-containing protein [Spirochaetales bacterium]HRW24454.1 transporter substrate-binding domain-containing protein [Spirochaetia bacterium]
MDRRSGARRAGPLGAPAAAALALAMLALAGPAAVAQARGGFSFGPDEDPRRYEALRVAVEPGSPPLQFVDASGRPAGFLVDAVNAIGEEAGVAVALYPMAFPDAVAALASGRVDVVLGVPYSVAALGEAGSLAVSEPLFASAVAVVSLAGDRRYDEDAASLAGDVLALTRGSPAYDFLKAIRSVRFNETGNPADALELLALGRADAFLEDRAVASYLLERRDDADRFAVASSYWLPVEYCLAVRGGDDYLLYSLNQGIRAIKESGVYSAVYERWFDDSEAAARRRLRNAMTALVAALAVFLLGGGAAFWWNRQLASNVRARTSELREANDELGRLVGEAEDKKEFIAQILESSPRGLVTSDADGVVSVCNARARVIGLLDPDPVGRPALEYPFLAHFLTRELTTRVLGGESMPFSVSEWTRPDGARLHIRYATYPQLDHEGRVVGLIFSFEDHTVEQAMRERLAEREKGEALGRIVAGVAHEIRNPLTSIKAFVELLPRKMDDPRFLREMGSFVPREVERVDKLIRDLIDFSRPRRPVRTAVDIGELAESTLSLSSPALAKRGVTTTSSVERGLLCSVDADQLRQCVMNFVLNAADSVEEARAAGTYGDAGGGPDIELAAYAAGDKAVVELSDRGAGVAEADLGRVFEPFFTTKRGGVGLGLPLSRQYVEENGGRLELRGRAGGGAVAVMEFPLEGRGRG